MSVALSAVVRGPAIRPPAPLFDALTQAVERLAEHDGRWSHPTAHRGVLGAGHQHRLQSSGEEGERLRAVLGDLDGPDVRLAATARIRGWRFPGQPSDPDEPPQQLALRVACWGPEFAGADEREGGAAELTFDPVWPFRTPGGTVTPEHAAALDENRSLLLRLLDEVVTAVDPISIRLHTDDGPPLPFNAHLAYYRDAAAVLADLAWIEELVNQGSPRRRIPPLADPGPGTWMLHEWRSAGHRQRLLSALRRLGAVAPAVGPQQVHDVQVAGSCPVLPCRHGFLVLSAAAFVDGFVDPFFTELADLVAG